MRKGVRQRFPYTDSLWNKPSTEQDWLKLRCDDITATDAAALFGVSPYCTVFELYHRKAGSLSVEIAENERMLWGKRLQNAIAEGICADNGWKILSRDPYLYVRSPHFVRMGASPDYVVFCPKRGVGALEIKNVDWRVAKEDWAEDEAPVHIELQLQHQLECSQFSWGAVGGLIGGNEARVIVRERDREVGAEIGNRVTDMHRRVRDVDPPPPDYLADFDTIKALNRFAAVGKVMDLALPNYDEVAARIVELCASERAANAAKKLATEDVKRAQAELLTLIGDAERLANVPGFNVSAVTVHKEEATQTVKAHSYRLITVTKAKQPAANKHASSSAA